jgi:hypothetical protein
MEVLHSVAVALNIYENHRAASKRYYEKNKERLLEKRKQKYLAEHPNPKPCGRPKKEKPPTICDCCKKQIQE